MENERDTLRRLMITVNKIDGLYYLAAKKCAIKDNMLTLLYALDDGRPHTQKQICEEWLIPKTTLNTIVKECSRAGYITLIHGEHTREKVVSITGEGQVYARTMLEGLYRAENLALDKTLQRFSPEFVDALEQFTEALQEEFDKELPLHFPDGPAE